MIVHRSLLYAVAVVVLVLAGIAGVLQGEVVALQHRPASVVIEQVPVQSAVQTDASRCPAASCLTVPYVDGGLGGVGQLITGAAGWGGKAVEYNDDKGAPEGWFQNGGWYVAVARGELGPGYCLVDVKTRHWRTRCLSWQLLGWLLTQYRGRG